MEKLVHTSIRIGHHKQPICYEREGILCTDCKRLGHTIRGCNFSPNISENKNTKRTEHLLIKGTTSEWQTVYFTKKGNKSVRKEQIPNPGMKQSENSNVKIKSFDSKTGKFLDTNHRTPNHPAATSGGFATGKDKGKMKLDLVNSGQTNLDQNGKKPISSTFKGGPPIESHGPNAWYVK